MSLNDKYKWKRNLYIARHMDIKKADRVRIDKIASDKAQARFAIVRTLNVFLQHGCTENEIIKFLSKYAKRYNVSLTIAMIKHQIDVLNLNCVRTGSEFVEINSNWDPAKRFLFDDIKTLKVFGFNTDEIIKIFNVLLLDKYFTKFEKKIAMSESIIEKI